MFSGIVETTGRVVALPPAEGGRLVIGGVSFAGSLVLGESVAINGACMTVVDSGPDFFAVDLSLETLRITRMGAFAAGERVNLERALRLSDRLGGHLVLGHVDCLGRIETRTKEAETVFFRLFVPAPHHRYLIVKGSIAVDGISLTVNGFRDLLSAESPGPGSLVELAIIPHTIRETTLSDRGPGETVHLEMDLVGKYVDRFGTVDRIRAELSGG